MPAPQGRSAADSFASSRGRVLDSTPGMAYEASVGAPGTYDCEVTGGALRCMVFASRKPKPAGQRFEKLVQIIRGWLPMGWTSVERTGPMPARGRSRLRTE